MTDEKALELDPCPFCGHRSKLVERHNPMSKWRHSVDCCHSECGMSGPVAASKAEAIALWNRRFIADDVAKPAAAGEIEAVQRLFPNCDSWGAADWFERLANAVMEQDKAVVAGNDIAIQTYRNIAASSALELVRGYRTEVRAALASTAPAAEKAIDEFVKSQQPLGAEFEKVLGDNRDELYEP